MGLTKEGLVKNTGGGVKRIDGWVDTQLGNTTGKHSGSIQMGKGCGWGWISQIISWHVDGLDRGDRTELGGCDTLLHGTHISCKGWLVTDSGWDTTEKGRHLGTSLGETENVVNEEKHITTLASGWIWKITEGLSDGKTGQGHTGTGTRGLVHLSIHESDLGVITLDVNDTTLDHFVVEIVTLTGTLTDTCEHGETSVGSGDVVDKLHDEHSLSDTGTTKETNLSTLGVWGEEVDNLDTSLKDTGLDVHFNELWSLTMDWEVLIGLDWTTLIDWLANDVKDTAKSGSTDWDLDGITSVCDWLSTHETLSTVHGNGTDSALTQMLCDLENETGAVVLNLKGVEDWWKATFVELDINDGTNDAHNLAFGSGSRSGIALSEEGTHTGSPQGVGQDTGEHGAYW
eukprot:m.351566 g.351566  ORF g.351566 m.351566 type:complete len:400 (-) comp16279_c0_seq1:777-1976(-)